MIKEVKLKRTKKLKKNGGKYKHKHNNKNSNGKKQGKTLKKNTVMQKTAMQKLDMDKSTKQSVQEGGTNNGNCKEKFEVKRMSDIDYSQMSLTKYLKADTDWGNSPGPPPMDCTIM